MKNLHSIGALFPKTAKSGKTYMSGILFQSSKKEDNVQLVSFPTKAKSGMNYYPIYISPREGENDLECLIRLEDELKKHIEALKNKDSISPNELPF